MECDFFIAVALPLEWERVSLVEGGGGAVAEPDWEWDAVPLLTWGAAVDDDTKWMGWVMELD